MINKKHNPPNPEGRRNSSVSSFKKSLHRCLNLYSKYLLTTHPNKTFNKIVILLFITSCITIFACRERVTPPPDTPQYIPPIVLSLEDVSCTDAFIRVKFVDTTIERSFILKRDGATVASVANSPLDTMLIDENLLPKRIYRYKAYRVKGGASVDSSMELRVETMDTTSHDFTWQIDTLGDGYSVLSDVAIINDTLAYAVGEVYKRDSLGNWDPLRYNLAKWNGQQWELKRVTVNFRGNLITPPLYGIYAFTAADIWIAAGMAIHGSESNWVGHDVRALTGVDALSFTKCWGVSSTDMYFVGLAGSIAHYDGARWRRLESGTTLGLTDIYGISKNEIYAVGLDWGSVRGIVIRYDGSKWNKLIDGIPEYDSELYGITRSVWIDEKGVLYTAGNFLYHYRFEKWRFVKSLNGNCFGCNPYYIYRGFLHSIRGNKSNDIFIFGEINTVRHFNGVSWSEVGLPYYPLKYDIFWYSCDVKGKLAIGVGKIGRRALAIIIKR